MATVNRLKADVSSATLPSECSDEGLELTVLQFNNITDSLHTHPIFVTNLRVNVRNVNFL